MRFQTALYAVTATGSITAQLSIRLVIVRAADIKSYGTPVHELVFKMDTVSDNKFRNNQKTFVE
ncbi:MAG: hypothetical protein ACI9W2_001839 [Gammaproteobacteria bacterium]|jgi:hypothetical protein